MIGSGELSELYQQVILDHNAKPRNFGPLAGATHVAKGHNPLCGDQIAVQLRVEGDTVREAHFVGQGCAISKASASLMTEAVRGKSKAEALALFESFHQLLTEEAEPNVDPARLGKLAVFAGVREFPMRVKCATLAWHTVKTALDGGDQTISTE